MSIVEIKGADKVFANGTRALAPVDLSVGPGEFITLLKMIANLLEPSSGSIHWWGSGFDHVGQEGKKLVFVFQDATLMPWARVRSNVRLPLDLAGVDSKTAEQRVDQALALVGLSKFDGVYPRQLSGGMQMRASIARALVTDPNLLLMDEPFGALDEFTRNKLDQDLLQLWQQKNLSVVFVTHSIYEAVYLSTRVVVLAARPGRVIEQVVIDEPYPRTDAFRVSQNFTRYARQMQELLAHANTLGEPASH